MIPPLGFGKKPTKGSGFGKIVIVNESLRAQLAK
jgi:hypothetical protein